MLSCNNIPMEATYSLPIINLWWQAHIHSKVNAKIIEVGVANKVKVRPKISARIIISNSIYSKIK